MGFAFLRRHQAQSYAEISLQLRDVQQLFNSLDPTPFPERDLDADAEEFIVGWALEHPSHLPIYLHIRLSQPPSKDLHADEVALAVRHYFAYRSEVVGRQLSQLLANGRMSLLVGLVCLALTVGGAHLVGRFGAEAWVNIVRESLLIGGWVAMWRPIQIFLYDWWPILRNQSLCQRLSKAEVCIEVLAPHRPEGEGAR